MATVTDAFTDTTGVDLNVHSPSAGAWAVGAANTFEVNSNQLRATAAGTGDKIAGVSGAGVGNDHYAQVKIVTTSGGSIWGGPSTRVTNTTNGTGYVLSHNDSNADTTFYFGKVADGTYTAINESGSASIAANDILRLESSGNSHTAKHGASTIYSGVSDSTYTTGVPGIYMYQGATTNVFDDFEGGDLGGAAAAEAFLTMPPMAPPMGARR